ncbi:MAG: fibronectin type III domain-containing protein, partial [Candidatus Onthomorpha sp.]|nr:fibronectin type III domain-containing protein [Candidatus Onthomorpha sp.]
MKKIWLCLLSALLTSFCLTAQTLGTAPNGVFTAADIEYWVGSGSQEAALVLVFNDGKTPQALVWGYRYDGTKTMKQMCYDIAAADPRFFFQECGGTNPSCVVGFGADANGNGSFSLQNPENFSDVVNPTTQNINPSTDVDGFMPIEDADRWQAGFSMTYWFLTSNGWTNNINGWVGAVWSDFTSVSGLSMQTATYVSMTDPNGSCPSVNGLNVAEIGTNDATIVWNPHTTSNSYILQIKDNEQTDWTNITEQTTTDTFFVFSNLDANTDYTFRVKADCGNDEESVWSSLAFKTLCNSVDELPYLENFDSYSSSGTEAYADCWNKFAMGTGDNINLAGAAPASGSRSLYFYSLRTNNFTSTALLPTFEEELSNLSIQFKLRSQNVYGAIIVGVVEDDTFVPVDTAFVSHGGIWEQKEVSLTSYEGNGGVLALRPYSSSTQSNSCTVYVDDVVVDYAPACLRPEGLTVARGDDATDVALNWSADENSHWLVFYKASDEETYSYAEFMTNSGSISNLEYATNYTFQLASVCSNGDTVRAFEQVEYTTPMLAENIPYSCNFEQEADAQEWMLKNGNNTNKWHIGTPNNQTNGVLYISKDGGSSAEYNTSSTSIVVAEKLFDTGESDSLTISFDLTIGGESTWDYLKVYWVDVDTNYIAATSTSTYYADKAYSNNVLFTNHSTYYFLNLVSGTQNFSVTIPNVANSMKKLVFVWKNDSSGGTQPGAVIDNISIQQVWAGEEPEPCDAPTDLAVNNITQTSADFSWNGTASSYEVRLGSNAAETVTTTSTSFTDLTAGTTYTAYVRAICEESNSAWVSFTFTTVAVTPVPPTVTTLAATGVTHNSATLNGTITAGNETITAQGFMYKTTAASTWTTVSASGTTLVATVNTLAAETEYQFKAFATTASGTVEGTVMTFTTTAT